MFNRIECREESQYDFKYIGSCIFDACFSIGIGPLIFPIVVSERFATITGSYIILVSIVAMLTLALRKKVDKISGVLFIFLYLFSYLTLYA